MNKLKKWLQSAAGIATIILILVGLLLLIVDRFSVGANDNYFYSNVLIGIATNLCGIVITISFVQYFIDKQDAIEERNEEIKKIKRYDRYMQTLVNQYFKFYMALTTRLGSREDFDIKKVYEHQFKFSDLADMYRTSAYICEGLMEPTITLFYKAEENLQNYMLKMLENIDFKYTHGLENILQDFLEKTAKFNVRGSVLGALNTSFGEKKSFEEISKWIADENELWLEKYKNGELKGINVMYPYVILYFGIQKQVQILKEYRNYVTTLIADEKTEG